MNTLNYLLPNTSRSPRPSLRLVFLLQEPPPPPDHAAPILQKGETTIIVLTIFILKILIIIIIDIDITIVIILTQTYCSHKGETIIFWVKPVTLEIVDMGGAPIIRMEI